MFICFHLLGIIIFHIFQDGYCTTNQLWFMVDISTVNGGYKPTNTTGAAPCGQVLFSGCKVFLRLQPTAPKLANWLPLAPWPQGKFDLDVARERGLTCQFCDDFMWLNRMKWTLRGWFIQPIYGNIGDSLVVLGLQWVYHTFWCVYPPLRGNEVFRQTDVSSLNQQTWEFKYDIGYSTKLFGIEST